MRLLSIELRKLFSNKIFVLIIATVFVLNAYLMFRTATTGEITASDYKTIYAELDGMSDKEKLQWLDERANDFTGEYNFEYSYDLLYELYDECYRVVTYKDYLKSIESQAKSMTSVSIFSDNSDSFNYRNIVKTPPAYKNVQDVEPVFDVSKGVNSALENNFTDILCGFILLFSVLSLMISEREQGISGLLFPLKKGRGSLILIKLSALAITTILTIIFIYAENLFISAYLYGLGDLLRPIQSLNGFIGCNLKINVIEYIFIFITFKFLAFFSICTVLSLIAIVTKNTISFYGISAVLLILEGVLYSLIQPLSIYSTFRYINLIAFIKVNDIFCNYKNINFWEHPINLMLSSVITVIFIIIISFILSTFIYAKKRNIAFHKISFKINLIKNSTFHSPIYYTLYKSLIQQKGILIVVFSIFIFGVVNSSFTKQYDVGDVYYKYYANEFEGEIYISTHISIAKEQKRFDDLNQQLNKILEDTDEFSPEANEIQKQLAPEMGFSLIKERYEQIRDTENSQIFYDTGYKRLFGKTGYDDDMKYALASMLLCVFIISPLIAHDNKYKMYSIINSTASGKIKYLKRNIIISSVYGMIAVFIWTLCYFTKIYQFYGFRGLNAPIQSITEFKSLSISLKVWQYIAIILVLRAIFVICASLIMLWVSSKSKNSMIALLVNSAIFILPIIVYIFGSKTMINIGMNPFLSVNILLNQLSFIHFLIPTFILCLIVYKFVKSKEV